MPMNFSRSEELLRSALTLIPNGTQTFSKSRTQYPVGHSPLYIEKAKGCYLYDVDFGDMDRGPILDTVSGLGAILLGYRNGNIDLAVIEQIRNAGVIFSLPHPLEIEVSKQLTNMIPAAEMVRFGKNGSDVTSGAVRLARHITGRDHIACCGYHGWQDWYVGITSRCGGVPEAVRGLTHRFEYNNLESLQKLFQDYPGQVACVIMEPVIDEMPKGDFLHEVQYLCRQNGALFILDEMITGFRFDQLSAQKSLNLEPDLSCFGKAMGNGYPISALVGKAKYMERISELHFSFTFGGDCIGLAAASAVIGQLSGYMGRGIYYHGKILQRILSPACEKVGIRLLGYPSRLIFKFQNDKDKWKIFQECLKRHILCIGFLNLTYAFGADEIERLVDAFMDIIPNLDRIELEFEPIDPLFKIR